MMTVLLLLTAQAAVPAPPVTAAAPIAKPALEKKKCQLVYQARSRIPDKLCLTQAEWDKMADANRDDWTSSRNARSAGRAGTIVNSDEGQITTIQVPHTKGPGPH